MVTVVVQLSDMNLAHWALEHLGVCSHTSSLDCQASADSVNREWRHKLDHDSESVFWLIFSWSVGIQPVDKSMEGIDPNTWMAVTGDVAPRVRLIYALAHPAGIAYSFCEPL